MIYVSDKYQRSRVDVKLNELGQYVLKQFIKSEQYINTNQ